jgi:hypothetical protein
MSIRLHALNLLVPIRRIAARYPGGLQACIDDHEALLGTRVWFDGRLWRDGASTPEAIRELVDGWRAVGLHPVVQARDGWHWHDVCVVDTAQHSPTLPCAWIEVDAAAGLAWLGGTEPGHPVGPADFPAPPSGSPRESGRPSLASLHARIAGRPLPAWVRTAVMRG